METENIELAENSADLEARIAAGIEEPDY